MPIGQATSADRNGVENRQWLRIPVPSSSNIISIIIVNWSNYSNYGNFRLTCTFVKINWAISR